MLNITYKKKMNIVINYIIFSATLFGILSMLYLQLKTVKLI